MTLLTIMCSVFLGFNITLSVALILAWRNKVYVQKIAQKFGRDEFEKYQIFFDKEKLRDALAELKISGRTTDMLLNAKTYCLLLSVNSASLYYSFPPTTNALLPYQEITSKNIFFLIEKAAIQPKPHENILYFSKYKAGG